jgi:hypothetical protein
MKKLIVGLTGLLLASCVFAVTPQFWTENSQQSFADGNAQSVSIGSDGALSLAPELKRAYEGKEAIIWKIAHDSRGNVYAATGNEAKIIKVDSAGKTSTFFKTGEIAVQALAVDRNNNVYAATSPDGKIYKISPEGVSSVFFDPDDKYIWSLAFDDQDNLYAGTGNAGKTYKIDRSGSGTVFADTSESNITALEWNKGRLLAGSDPNGILYSVEPGGKVTVLFDTDLQQITAIYPALNGDVYFSAISGVPSIPQQSVPQPTVQPAPEAQAQPQDSGQGGDVTIVTSVDLEPMPQQSAMMPAPQRLGVAAQLYRLTDAGASEEVYTSPDDLILAIGEDRQGKILLCTGKKAKLISIGEDHQSTVLLKAAEEQLTGILTLQGSLWLATANPGNLYQQTAERAAHGTYFSDIKDTQTASTWGRINWKSSVPNGASLTLYTRAGNTKTPDDTWSTWQSAGTDPQGKQVVNPKARFLQWKAEFATTDPKATASLSEVNLAYVQQNIKPAITALTIHPPGTLFRSSGGFGQEGFAGVPETDTVDKPVQDSSTMSSTSFDTVATGKKEYRKGYQSVTWTATDANQDDLRFKVYYRTAGNKKWKLLADKLQDKAFALDTKTMPDGTYVVRVVAVDSGSNPEESVLSDSKDSEPFDVDNTPPALRVDKAKRDGSGAVIDMQASDLSSPIKELKYSVQPGEWVNAFPVDSINDSKTETYHIVVKTLPADSDGITLQCTDRMDNTLTIQHPLQ